MGASGSLNLPSYYSIDMNETFRFVIKLKKLVQRTFGENSDRKEWKFDSFWANLCVAY